MRKQTHDTADIQEAMVDVADDVRALLAVTKDVAEDRVVTARKRVQASLDAARDTYGRVQKAATAKAKAADRYVRGNPYRAIGIAFGCGAILGLLLRHRRRDDD